MKEEQQRNELFLLQQERLVAEGKTRKERQTAAVEEFKLGGVKPGHAYRAWLARLADPKKYKGKYSARAKALQLNRNNKTNSPVAASSEEVVAVEANA